jgi:two-component system phosphate regulon sensor histidine kinase PhoR
MKMFRLDPSSWLLPAAFCLGVILLVLFQVNWLQHSRKLIEEQFDQKVTMALCSAVENLEKEQATVGSIDMACQEDEAICTSGILKTNLQERDLHSALSTALNRYDIGLEFAFDIRNNPYGLAEPASYSCQAPTLLPEDHFVQVAFKGKEEYVIEKMGFMLSSSIIILIFICALFGLTLYRLLQQRRLHQMSIEFFNNMAHEFRTPLTNIRLAVNLWKKKSAPSSQERFFSIIQDESQRLTEQVERMLHVAKLDEGEYLLEKKPLDLKILLEKVISDMRIQAAEKKGQINLQYANSHPSSLQGDPLHLSNALRNIIDNAVKYSPEAPQIDIVLNGTPQKAHLCIKDQGIGIHPNHHQKIFDKFFRLNQGNLHNEKGFGLGLAYTKKIIELHEGTIKLESDAGKGTHFHVYLPLSNDN